MKILILTLTLSIYAIIGFGQNLISNPSFENELGLLDCNGWYNACGEELSTYCDTNSYCQVGFQQDSPSLQEHFSLALEAGSPREGFAITYVTGQRGTNVYQLKFWMKSSITLANTNSVGYAYLGKKTQNLYAWSKHIYDTTSVWKQYTLIDTLTTLSSDSIQVRLSAGECKFCIQNVYFDQIELTIIESIIDENIKNNVKVYPNPSSDKVTIEIAEDITETCIFTLYNSTGQRIESIQTSNPKITLNNNHYATGVYFFKIQNAASYHIIGQGKILIE